MAKPPIEVFNWWLPADMASNRPKRSVSRWKMTRADAARYPGAECIEESREVRHDLYGTQGYGAGLGANIAKPRPRE